jgi:hypothetical protein
MAANRFCNMSARIALWGHHVRRIKPVAPFSSNFSTARGVNTCNGFAEFAWVDLLGSGIGLMSEAGITVAL